MLIGPGRAAEHMHQETSDAAYLALLVEQWTTLTLKSLLGSLYQVLTYSTSPLPSQVHTLGGVQSTSGLQAALYRFKDPGTLSPFS